MQTDARFFSLFLEHGEIILYLSALIVERSGLILHFKEIVVELPIKIVILLAYCRHLFFKIVHEAEQF